MHNIVGTRMQALHKTAKSGKLADNRSVTFTGADDNKGGRWSSPLNTHERVNQWLQESADSDTDLGNQSAELNDGCNVTCFSRRAMRDHHKGQTTREEQYEPPQVRADRKKKILPRKEKMVIPAAMGAPQGVRHSDDGDSDGESHSRYAPPEPPSSRVLQGKYSQGS